jgi:hypothetical protein
VHEVHEAHEVNEVNEVHEVHEVHDVHAVQELLEVQKSDRGAPVSLRPGEAWAPAGQDIVSQGKTAVLVYFLLLPTACCLGYLVSSPKPCCLIPKNTYFVLPTTYCMF